MNDDTTRLVVKLETDNLGDTVRRLFDTLDSHAVTTWQMETDDADQ